MIKKRFKVSIAIVAFVVVSIFVFSKSRFTAKKTGEDKPVYATAKKGDIIIRLDAKGRLKPLKSTVITAPRRGGKVTYLIPEGTYVKKGDLLAQFDKVDLEKAVNDAKFNLEEELIKEDTRKRESDKKITKTRLILQGTRDSLRKILPEVIDGKKTAKDLQWAKYNLKEAGINYEEAKKAYEQYQIKGSPQLRRRRDALKKAERNLAEATMRSPSQGLVVYEIIYRPGSRGKIKPGDTVWRRQSIISLPDLSKMLVIVEISEVDLSKARNGQKCTIKLDAYPDKIFIGKVTNKGNLVKNSVFLPGVKIVEVEIDRKSVV